MDPSPVRDSKDGVFVDVWVVPGASRAEVSGLHGDKLKLRVISPPEGGRANVEATAILEELTGARVVLVRGMSSRHKVFQVANSDAETVVEKLGL